MTERSGRVPLLRADKSTSDRVSSNSPSYTRRDTMAKKADNKVQGSGGDQGGRSKGSSKKEQGRKSSGNKKSGT